MMELVISLLALGVVFLSYPVGKRIVNTYRAGDLTSDENKDNLLPDGLVPELKNLLSSEAPDKVYPVQRVVTLEARNTVVFRGVVDKASVTEAMRKIAKISREIPKSETIYLVLDTPGGSVMDGAEFIDFLSAIPQRIKTVTMFAASMGFHIVENNLGERLITRQGILMAHPASLGGLDGQMDGQLENRLMMLKRGVDFLDNGSAKRMGLGFQQYKQLVHDEYWVHGFDSVNKKVADAEVLLKCGNSMDGTDTIQIPTLFGMVSVEFEKCPLMKQPVAIHMGEVPERFRDYVYSIIYELFYNQEAFTRNIIVTNKFNTIFR